MIMIIKWAINYIFDCTVIDSFKPSPTENSFRPSPTDRSPKTFSSRYRQKGSNENTAITPRSGLDTGMSFSFSSFGDEKHSSSPAVTKQFKPTRIPSYVPSDKRSKPTKIGPISLHEYGSPSGKLFY